MSIQHWYCPLTFFLIWNVFFFHKFSTLLLLLSFLFYSSSCEIFYFISQINDKHRHSQLITHKHTNPPLYPCIYPNEICIIAAKDIWCIFPYRNTFLSLFLYFFSFFTYFKILCVIFFIYYIQLICIIKTRRAM